MAAKGKTKSERIAFTFFFCRFMTLLWIVSYYYECL